MEKKRFVIKGYVQGVGYRAFVRMIALRMGIKGRVRNLDNGDVEIIAVGPGETIGKFKEAIKTRSESPFEPDVHEILEENYEGKEEFRDFRVDYGYEMRVPEREMIERSEIGILAFGYLTRRVDSGFKEMGEKIDNVSEKIDKGFAEMGGKIDSGFKEMGEKIDTVSDKLDEGFGKTYEKLDEISGKLDKNIEKTDEFHTEMVDKFEYLDVKYGEFSKTLSMMIEKMDSIEKDIKEMKDAFIKLVNHIVK